MNSVQQGSCRDRQIVSTVDDCGALDSEQVRLWHFRTMKHGDRKARQRLASLSSRRMLRRARALATGRYAYFTHDVKQVHHRLALNWVRLHFMRRCKSWDELRWQYEVSYGSLRCDAFAAIRNKVAGEWRFWFVEMDCASTAWDKTAKYNRLYESQGYLGQWWTEHTKRFPVVLVVCAEAARLRTIQQDIAANNTHGLEFDVRSLDSIIEEVRKW